MAKGFKTGGRDFQKGKPGGPGRPPHPPDFKQLKELTRTELEYILNKFMFHTKEEIEAIMKEKTTTAIEAMVGAIILKAVDHGDQIRLNFVLDRLIGKVKDVIDVNGKITLEDLVAGSREGDSHGGSNDQD
jgi:hypothetical protein